MESDPTYIIETWFSDHDGDGEFVSDAPYPYSLIPSTSPSGKVIYTTKHHAVELAIKTHKLSIEFGMIGRYGLPQRTDMEMIQKAVGERPLLFLGDMDPPDLMIFAWLRASLAPLPVVHLGISDAYLDTLNMSIDPVFTIPLSTAERESIPVLYSVFPDLKGTIGPRCLSLLEQGIKIEVEAIVSISGEAASLLRPALDLR